MNARRSAHHLSPADQARKRITDRYSRGSLLSLRPLEALHTVAQAALFTAQPPDEPRAALPQPTETDVLDGLSLVNPAHQQAEVDELRLILFARHLGVTWERIGAALGYGAGSAPGGEKLAQLKGAQGRCTALVKRHPRFATDFDAQLQALDPDGEP